MEKLRKEFKQFAHSHTVKETEEWVKNHNTSLDDMMYSSTGRPVNYDTFQEECDGIYCVDGTLWN